MLSLSSVPRQIKSELETVKDELQRITSAHTSQGVELDDVKTQLRKERDARRTMELERSKLSEALDEERESAKRLQASMDARKQGFDEQKDRMERLATEEKESLRRELASLNDTLRQVWSPQRRPPAPILTAAQQERLTSSATIAQQKQRLDAQEVDHRETLARELALAKSAVQRDVETRMAADAADKVCVLWLLRRAVASPAFARLRCERRMPRLALRLELRCWPTTR